jgi:hypothetical protein
VGIDVQRERHSADMFDHGKRRKSGTRDDSTRGSRS